MSIPQNIHRPYTTLPFSGPPHQKRTVPLVGARQTKEARDEGRKHWATLVKSIRSKHDAYGLSMAGVGPDTFAGSGPEPNPNMIIYT